MTVAKGDRRVGPHSLKPLFDSELRRPFNIGRERLVEQDAARGLAVDADLDVCSLWFRTSDILNVAALR
jgi:hypothetical protein